MGLIYTDISTIKSYLKRTIVLKKRSYVTSYE